MQKRCTSQKTGLLLAGFVIFQWKRDMNWTCIQKKLMPRRRSSVSIALIKRVVLNILDCTQIPDIRVWAWERSSSVVWVVTVHLISQGWISTWRLTTQRLSAQKSETSNVHSVILVQPLLTISEVTFYWGIWRKLSQRPTLCLYYSQCIPSKAAWCTFDEIERPQMYAVWLKAYQICWHENKRLQVFTSLFCLK